MSLQSLTKALIALAPVASLAIVHAESFVENCSDVDFALLNHAPSHSAFYHTSSCPRACLEVHGFGRSTAPSPCWNLSLEFQFLHVGKCGGTSLERAFEHNIDLNRAEMLSHVASNRMTFICASQPHHKYIFFVRAPISRFISGWLSRFRYGSPRHPEKRDWDPGEKMAYNTFHSPDELGCALSSTNLTRRNLAEAAIQAIEHTRQDLNFYWNGVEYVRRCMDQIFFVGRTEHFRDDVEELVKRLQGERAMIRLPVQQATSHATPAKYNHFKELGSCAIQNLRRWYRRDYEIIEELVSAGKLPSSYAAEVRRIDGWNEESQSNLGI